AGAADRSPRTPAQSLSRIPPHLLRRSYSTGATGVNREESLGTAPQKHLDQGAERPAAVRHAVLGGGRRLAEAHLQLRRIEHRVIAEAPRAARLREHEAVARRLYDLGHGAR